MEFKDALWNDTDLDYAPGLNWSGRYAYWKPTKKFRDLGCPAKPIRLPGVKGDGRDRERAREARLLTRSMIETYTPAQGPERGTWAWVILKWKSDPHSRYNGCGENTRDDYDYRSGKWATIIGHMQIEHLTYEEIGLVISTMRERDYSDNLIQRLFVTLRHLARYARGPLGQESARGVVETLEPMKFRNSKKRDVAPTPEQIRMIIDEADARGLFAFATGLLFQWTYGLRAVDVRGQWLKDDGKGGVVRNGKRWQDGLTWQMFDPGLTHFSKTTSKTKTDLKEIALTPELQSRLTLLRGRDAVGPVIVSERRGEPYTKYSWSSAFRRLRNDLELPEEIKMMDTRAGAITEAKNLGADPFALRDFGTHAHVDTTDRYARQRSENMNKVVQLRSRK